MIRRGLRSPLPGNLRHQRQHPPLLEPYQCQSAGVEALLASGADPDAHDDAHNTALIFAARDGRLEIARALIEHSATVDWIDGEGVTPLILAAFKGHQEIAELLLDRGADPEIRDQWGRRALDYALKRGEDDAIARLLRSAR